MPARSTRWGLTASASAAAAVRAPVVLARVAAGRATSEVAPDAQRALGLPGVMLELAVDVEMLAAGRGGEVAVEPVLRVDPHRRRGSADVAYRRGAVVALHRDVFEHEAPDLDRFAMSHLGHEPERAAGIDSAVVVTSGRHGDSGQSQRDDQHGADEYALHASSSCSPARASPEPPCAHPMCASLPCQWTPAPRAPSARGPASPPKPASQPAP